jgi:uncharacterized membrane protein YccC
MLARFPIHDPGFVSLRSAARAAIVMPSVFAFADKVIANPRVATFAAFGSFAMLVLVEFGGPPRSRLLAYLTLGAAGAANIVIGTLCSRNALLAAAAMAVIGFAILFSGVINGYFAAASTSALLTFILAATIPAPFSQVGFRLEGWLLAAGVGTFAQMVLWPQRRVASLRTDAARACRAVADLAKATLAGDRQAVGDETRAAGEAVGALRKRFLATPYRPTGPTRPQAALSQLVDELDWLLSYLAPPEHGPGLELCRQENVDAVDAVVSVLSAAAVQLDGGDEQPNFERLEQTRRELVRALAREIPELPSTPDEAALVAAVDPTFRIRVLSYGAQEVAHNALTVNGRRAPVTESVLTTLRATEELTVEHASARSVWFRNSVRGAAGLAVAVYIAQRSGLQHAFWVVLGTLSVLRSNALGTGWSIVSALAGTAAGIVVGAGLVLAIGTHEVVLWIVLPPAVLLGSYAPRAISFAAGQAGFTVVLFVLFNLIQPVGWRVGLVRIEDVAIGFAISLGVGLLFWPRGAGALLRQNLAFAYARNADYVVAAERELVEGTDPFEASRAARTAVAASHRLDDAVRQFLAERTAEDLDRESVVRLVAGAGRVQRVADSLTALAQMGDGNGRFAACGRNLDAEAASLRAWYVTLGDALANATSLPPPNAQDGIGRQRLLQCVREAIASGDKQLIRPALDLLWASRHLDALWRLEQYVTLHAEATRPGAAELARRTATVP